ncbi:MAG: hypothetical protein M1834_009302 [Cirrosporium novae-zelandiae]|nr:MAG: hypothetical protein M1834_009302 [Cirrosporium novae-zelandiae]
MPAIFSIAERLSSRALPIIHEAEEELENCIAELAKRISIQVNATSSPGLIAASKEDPWNQAGKYSLGWVYFSIILLVLAMAVRVYDLHGDKVRVALHREAVEETAKRTAYAAMGMDYEKATQSAMTDASTRQFFPSCGPSPEAPRLESSLSSIGSLNSIIAAMRWIFYRQIPNLKIWKFSIAFPSVGILALAFVTFVFVTLYSFVPQPLYYASIRYGSPPLAIRAGMIAIAMLPWIISLGVTANPISFLTGIGHERLNALHRWGSYIFLFLSLVHTIPFYVTPVWSDGAWPTFKVLFPQKYIVYGTGVASLVPLLLLTVHSLPFFRSRMYEVFKLLHVPIAIVFTGMLFWHTKNFLTSWHYLWTTVAIWILSYIARLCYLNWTCPWRLSFLIGEEAAIQILSESALKVTIPTQKRWKPGQYVYLRMPGIAPFGNHPFTIASLCSDDFPSEYGPDYKDMAVVFRPFSGFTRKALLSAQRKGPLKTYRAFIDGPYGGMSRSMTSFDTVVLVAGGSGITAVVSHLYDLIKRMRDGKAVTRKVHLIWAMKRPEVMQWFQEEIRICREFAPPDSMHCEFFITAAKRYDATLGTTMLGASPTQLLSGALKTAGNRLSGHWSAAMQSHRNSAFIMDEAAGNKDRERELRRENEDAITALPSAYMAPSRSGPGSPDLANQGPRSLSSRRPNAPSHLPLNQLPPPHPPQPTHQPLEPQFGFAQTPTLLQKSLMRFAFQPSQKHPGTRIEYGRPDIPYMLKGLARSDSGRRTCVFVCGPAGMRVDVGNCVARLQTQCMWGGRNGKEEIFLHTENYAI